MSVARKGLSRIGVVLLCAFSISGPAAGQTVDRAAEEAFWDSVKGCSSAAQVEAYLKAYPKGRYVGEARACLARLRRSSLSPGTALPKDCPACPEMVVVPAGSFTMGSPPGQRGPLDEEGPQRTVTIATPFAVGKYEVTRGEYDRFVAATGYPAGNSCYTYEGEGGRLKKLSGRDWRNPGFRQTDRHPVTCVDWRDARAYVGWLSQRTGKRYRLLSEAEWEYAARADTTTLFYWGEDTSAQCDFANGAEMALRDKYGDWKWDTASCRDGYVHTAPVGSFGANAFGLHDMLGNVWEWVEDCWHDSYADAPSDGQAWTWGGNCKSRVVRGGSWAFRPLYLRPAGRLEGSVGTRNNSVGFRVALTLAP